jgi:hypothetical protein
LISPDFDISATTWQTSNLNYTIRAESPNKINPPISGETHRHFEIAKYSFVSVISIMGKTDCLTV